MALATQDQIITMSTAEHLAQYGLTSQQARDFILANLETPEVIFDAAKQFGVTSWMLAEIVGGVSTPQVMKFFSERGRDTAELDGDGVIYRLNFDNRDAGEYTEQAFAEDLLDHYQYVHLDGAADVITAGGSQALEITSLADGIEKSFQAVKMIDGQRELFFSYDFRIDAPFDFTIGKLPGFGAITGLGQPIPTGGKTAAEAPGFSYRLSFKEDGSLYLYYYDQDRDGDDNEYGSYLPFMLNGENYIIPFGEVQHVEMYARMNDVGETNGEVAVFINGEASARITDANLRQQDEGIDSINTLYMDFFHGGGPEYAPAYDSKVIFDNFEVGHLPEDTGLLL